ncbi:hypothetical protein [Stieleria varia]|uniref:Uncharacterized protein n=1 Tax=Stieleria varia TaxID=2528005 RepID=A0A5C6A3B5_9BACT|nr:hypothetical protein [Stieleria varia]TWT93896.1 hypothetical protein Pla52n_57240 [Stieleria varia]
MPRRAAVENLLTKNALQSFTVFSFPDPLSPSEVNGRNPRPASDRKSMLFNDLETNRGRQAEPTRGLG